MSDFGQFLRQAREQRRASDPSFSVRQLAARIGVEPSFLSKVERGIEPPPSEEKVRALALELDIDPDILLALAGKVSEDLRRAILKRPRLFAQLIRDLSELPDDAFVRIVREVRDGNW